MDIAITQGRVMLAPIPPSDPEAPEGSVAGYMLNVVDGETGITVRISMEHANAAQLGQVLSEHTSAHPVWKAGQPIETFQALPGGLSEPTELGGAR